MSAQHLDMIRQVLDQQVIDSNHFPCGRVDDLEIGGTDLKIRAILIGNGVASERLPELARWISRKLFGMRITRIPWSEVNVITDKIKLRSTAKDLKFDERAGRIYRVVSKLPFAWKK
jgi:sporulation protein YlmC with PRC-barrel domain